MKTASLAKVTEIVVEPSPPSSVDNSKGKGLPFFKAKQILEVYIQLLRLTPG
jgi:hypothetical protein